eukprot:TRINITY_DN6659_c0_g4_i1.p1 TRINITY_DN6659_c0_g4~~TRINITY_DN6659_c0_g4_i1.p1  ORF type:complete len:108 (+),score=34.48 TRINITY_DN6659_c0_g4_i1:126-449(+)
MIQKRFREFVELNETLKKRFADRKEELPELPPKTTLLGKTPLDDRQAGIERYLNGLLKIPVIGESYVFRKFIFEEAKDLPSAHRNTTEFKGGENSQRKKQHSIESDA